MRSALSRVGRLAAPALLSTACIASALRGQSASDSVHAAPPTLATPAPDDSVAILPGLRVSTRSLGASVITIDSATIARSAARTLSELLLARVPGLSVRPRGGAELEGAEIVARGLKSTLSLPPLLVVDGVLAESSQDLPIPNTDIVYSRLDDFAPTDIQRLDVLRGPAASALYGRGAMGGVILLTTRAASAGPARLDVRGSVGLGAVNARFPANYQLSGTSSQSCMLWFNPSQTGCATPTALAWNPFEQASPFRYGRSTSTFAALSGAPFGTRLYVSGAAERADGVTTDDAHSRVGLRASVDRSLPGHLSFSARVGYVDRTATVPARGESYSWNNLVYRGLMGRAYDDSIHGFLAYPALVEEMRPGPASARLTTAFRTEWRPLEWLTVDAAGGQDRASESAYYQSVDSRYGTVARYDDLDSEHWKSGTLHAGARTSARVGSVVSLDIYTAYDDRRTHMEQAESSATSTAGVTGSWMQSWRGLWSSDQTATVRQHVALGSRLHLNGGTQWSVGRGIQSPFGLVANRNLDAVLTLPSFHPELELRLRGAAGYAFVGTYSVYQSSAYCWGYPCSTITTYDARSAEHEAGVDATWGRHAELHLTYYSNTMRDAPLYATVGWPYVYSATGDNVNRGIEALATLYPIDGAHIRWRSDLAVTTLKSTVRTRGNALVSESTSLADGYPLQGYWGAPYEWSDANGDGRVNGFEISVAPTTEFIGPSRPTLEIGVDNALSFDHGLELSALVDYRGGHYRDNMAEKMRCRYMANCAISDPSRSLEEQVTYVALASTRTHDIVDASFLRVRELAVSWTLPEGATRYLGGSDMTLRVAGRNLLTWSHYDGPDPEVGAPSANMLMPPQDMFASPLARRISIELRAGTRFGTR